MNNVTGESRRYQSHRSVYRRTARWLRLSVDLDHRLSITVLYSISRSGVTTRDSSHISSLRSLRRLYYVMASTSTTYNYSVPYFYGLFSVIVVCVAADV